MLWICFILIFFTFPKELGRKNMCNSDSQALACVRIIWKSYTCCCAPRRVSNSLHQGLGLKTCLFKKPPVQFSHSVVSNLLQPHESQHANPPCPSPTPGVHSDSCPSSKWCHPAISSSVIPFSSCPNPFQHQSIFQWVNSLHEVAKVLEFQL